MSNKVRYIPFYFQVQSVKNKTLRRIFKSRKRKYNLLQQNITLEFMKKDCEKVIKQYKDTLAYPPPFELKRTETEFIPKNIWIFWWQGLENINPLVRCCIDRFRSVDGFEVNIITKDNINKFIKIDDILYLYETGKIFIQTLSDIVRLRILRKFGGIYCDATIYLANKQYFESIVSDFSFYSNHILGYDPAACVSKGMYSGFFLATFKGNPLFEFADDCMTFFLKKHEGIINYLQIDYTLMTGYYNIPYIKEMIDAIPYNNPDIWWLSSVLESPFNMEEWNTKLMKNSIFKISTRKKFIKNSDVFTYLDFILTH